MTLLIDIIPGACDYCGCCVGVCPEDAIVLTSTRIDIVAERCTNCAKCVWACPFEALAFRNPKERQTASDKSDHHETVSAHSQRGAR